MKKLFENKILQAVFALAVSISLWAYVITNSNPTYTSNVNITNVDYIGLDDVSKNGLYLIGDLPVSVDVRVSGTRNLVTRTSSEYSASFDFSGISQPGDYIIRTKVNVPAGVTIKRVGPEEINVRIDSGKTQDFKTYLVLEGRHTEDYEVSLITDKIAVSGPSTLLSLISKLEVRVNTDNINGGGEMTYSAVAVDDSGRPIKDDRLTFDGNVKLNVGFLKQVKIETDFSDIPQYISDEYNVSISVNSENIRLKGDKAVLDRLQKVTADLSDVQFDPSEKKQKVKLSLSLPSGVSVYESDDNVIDAEITYETKNKEASDNEEEAGQENNENQD